MATNEKKQHRLRNDILLIVIILAAALCVWRVWEAKKTDGAYAVVLVDGEETMRLPLDQDRTIRLERDNGGYNILEIQDGVADITDASCPDHICVDSHSISKTGETITCLPNKTVIKIVDNSGNESNVDVIS